MWINKNIKIKCKQAKVVYVNDKYAQIENSKIHTWQTQKVKHI